MTTKPDHLCLPDARDAGAHSLFTDIETLMPLPSAPTHKPQRLKTQSSNDLLIKGILCILIGLGVVLAPRFISSPGMQSVVANSSWVGWFALALGLAFVGLYARQRMTP